MIPQFKCSCSGLLPTSAQVYYSSGSQSKSPVKLKLYFVVNPLYKVTSLKGYTAENLINRITMINRLNDKISILLIVCGVAANDII